MMRLLRFATIGAVIAVSGGILPRATFACASAPPAMTCRAPLPRDETRGLRGFADFHAHMFSNLGFGGFLFAGGAFVPQPEPDAMATALAPCEHTRFPHLVTRVVADEVEGGPHGPDGYPDFRTWPRSTTHVHQQMYVDWVYRSYLYGLRLLVIVATNAELLCEFTHHTQSCSDGEAAPRQIAAVREMSEWIANHEGGWLELAKSPEDAERIIADNRLAVVIGVEVDSLFGCGIGGRRECTEGDAIAALDAYEYAGVRQVTPVHLVDGAFGGAALYDERLSAAHYFMRGYYQSVRDCGGEGVYWRLRGSAAIPAAGNIVAFLHGHGWYAPELSDAVVGAEGHCNRLGLTPLGETLVRELMKRGMLIDLEHMSDRSAADTIALAAAADYPVMLSHTWFRDLKLRRSDLTGDKAFVASHWTELRAEMHRTAATVATVNRLGGVVGVLTNQGYVSSAGDAVPNDCDTSSKSFAQAYMYARRMMSPRGGVAFGSDFNGFPGQPSPRFGPFGCGGRYADPGVRRKQEEAQRNPVQYGVDRVDSRVLTMSRAGNRDFDFNTMGLAHHGLLPDLIADLYRVGVPPADVDALFDSARAYVAMWARARARAHELRRPLP